MKFAIIAACLAASSAAVYLTTFTGLIGDSPGLPSDAAVSYCFVGGFALALVIICFAGPANFKPVFSRAFGSIFLRSLPLVVSLWSVLAFFGCRVVAWAFWDRQFLHDLNTIQMPETLARSAFDVVIPVLKLMNYTGEEEWFQISLVLLTASLTFMTWHRMYHSPVNERSV